MTTAVDWVPTTPTEVVLRALRFVGEGYYKLGGGARFTAASPFAGDEPFDAAGNQFPGFCDCSGFTSWCARYRRGIWNTDAITSDARTRQKRFRLVGKGEPVRPSDFIVYPGPDKDHDGERDSPGHVGIITAVDPDFAAIRGKAEWWEALQVAHCTPRKQLTLGAIKLTDATLWAGKGYIVRPLHLQDAEMPEAA
jgi:CHAP domain-containing protein